MRSYQFSEEDILPGDSVEIEIVIQNRGLQNSNGDIDVSLNALNDIIGINIDSYETSGGINILIGDTEITGAQTVSMGNPHLISFFYCLVRHFRLSYFLN